MLLASFPGTIPAKSIVLFDNEQFGKLPSRHDATQNQYEPAAGNILDRSMRKAHE
jgi:hypothetical protein